MDADCGVGNFCELRICIAGCEGAAECETDGRCTLPDSLDVPMPGQGGTPELGEPVTVLGFGQDEARTVLRNAGDGPLTYRLEATNAALALDTEPAELAPGRK